LRMPERGTEGRMASEMAVLWLQELVVQKTVLSLVASWCSWRGRQLQMWCEVGLRAGMVSMRKSRVSV